MSNPLLRGRVVSPLMKLALPFLAGNIFGIVVLAVDRIWVGHVGTEALAALGMAHSVLMICVNSILGPAIGTLSGVAQAMGAGNRDRAARFFTQGMFIGLILGFLLCLSGLFLPRVMMEFMGGDSTVTQPAIDYLQISMMGLILHAPLFVLTFAIQGAGDAKTALKVQLVAPLVNAVLDPILIFSLDWGLQGAAWSTVIANAIALVCGVYYARNADLRFMGRDGHLSENLSVAKRVLAVGIPGTLEQLVRTVALFLVLKILAPFGAVPLAAYTTMIMVAMLAVFPGLALGQATATLVGQSLGAGLFDRAWSTLWISTGLYLVFMSVVGTGIYFSAEWLVFIFDRNPAVISEGAVLLRTMALAFPAIAIAVILSKTFGGAGKTIPPMISSAAAHLVFQVSAAALWSQSNGLIGAYWAIAMAFVVHGCLNLGLCLYFLRPSRLAREYSKAI